MSVSANGRDTVTLPGQPSARDGEPLDLAPHSQDAEEALLGATLMNPQSLYDTAFILEAEDFFIVRHGYVWQALVRLHQRGDAIDTRTVVDELHALDHLEAVGGESYLTYLPTIVPTALHAETYARIVKRAAIRRELLGTAGEIARLAHDEQRDIYNVLDDAHQAVLKVRLESGLAESGQADAHQAISEFFDVMERWRDGKVERGLQTGFYGLDRMTGGLLQDDLIIIAGRPSMGKSSLAIQMAYQLALDDQRVMLFSNEMNHRQIAARLFALHTGINTHVSNLGKLDDAQWAQMVEATGVLSRLPLRIDDSRGLTALQIRNRARRRAQTHGLDCVIVDYLSNVTAGHRRMENRNQEVGIILNTLRDMAGELHVPVVVVSQLSRAVEQRSNKRPLLSDLRDSGEIEQVADVVLFLYREGYYKERAGEPAAPEHNLTDLIVAKQRNGPTGDVPLIWRREITRFDSKARVKGTLLHDV